MSAGHIARQLSGRVTKSFALETSEPSTGETAVTNPRGAVRSSVSSRQPSEVFPVVDEEVVP